MSTVKQIMSANFWDMYKEHLFNFISSKVKSEEDAADIWQEVGLKWCQANSQGIALENPKAWLFQVARYTIADYYRINNRRIMLEPVEQTTGACVCDLTGFVIQNYLPEKYALPLYMSDVDQWSQQKIADELKLSLPATKSRIQRAREKLKALISNCLNITINKRGQIVEFELKEGCKLPSELLEELERLKLSV